MTTSDSKAYVTLPAAARALAREWTRAFNRYRALSNPAFEAIFDTETWLYLADRYWRREQQIAAVFERRFPGVDLFDLSEEDGTWTVVARG